MRNTVYSRLSARYTEEDKKENQMVRHFYNRGEDVPIWVIFEILYLSDLASYFECLNESVREGVLRELSMYDSSVDTDKKLLSILLYTVKALRNAVAHNSIIFDTRFKDRKISPVLKKWVEKETNIHNITLYSLLDYIIIVCCVLKRLDFSNIRAKTLMEKYKSENIRLQARVTPTIYTQIIQQNVNMKIEALELYLDQ